MSRIPIVCADYQRSNASKSKKVAKQQSFAGAAPTVQDLVSHYAKTNMKIGWKDWLGGFTRYLTLNDGEIQTQKANAIFTATLAPTFIAFNPISNQDQKTKSYTAWRQPISAVNSLLFSVPITMLINNSAQKMASKGYIKAIDLRSCPNESYLTRQFEREYKTAEKAGKLTDFFNSFSTEAVRTETDEEIGKTYHKDSAKKKAGKKAYGDLYVKHKRAEAKDLYQRLLHEDPVKLKADPLVKAQVENLDDYLKNNNLHNVPFKKFLQENFRTECVKIKTVDDGVATTRVELKKLAFIEQSKKIAALDFLKTSGLVDSKFTEETLRKVVNATRMQRLADAYAQVFGPNKHLGWFFAELGKSISRTVISFLNKDDIKIPKITLYELIKSLDKNVETLVPGQEGKSSAEIFKTFTNDANEKSTADMLTGIAKKLKELVKITDAVDSGQKKQIVGLVRTDLGSIAKQLMTNSVANLGIKYKGVQQYIGIFFNLGVIALTCTTLNWAYPRIVERVAPNLVKDDKHEKTGGHK